MHAADALIEKGYAVAPRLNTQKYPMLSALVSAMERQPAAVEQWLLQLDDVEESTTCHRTYDMQHIANVIGGLNSLIEKGVLLPASFEIVEMDELKPLSIDAGLKLSN